MIGIFGAAQSAMKHLSLAVLIGLSAMAGVSAYGDTLASWSLTSNATAFEGNIQYADSPFSPSLSSAAISLGTGVSAKNTSNTFGGDHFDTGSTTFSMATNSCDYLQVAFTVASQYLVSPAKLTYNIRRTSSGPTTFQWAYSTNGIDFSLVGYEESPSKTTEAGNGYELNLPSGLVLSGGTTCYLRIVAWGASGATGTFFFNKNITLEGTATQESSGDNPDDPDPPEPPVDPELKEWLELRPGHTIKEDFNAMGGSATADLPAPWRVVSTNALNCFSALGYALENGATTSTTQRAHFGSGTSTSGIYNLGAADNAVDRAVGFLSASGSSNKFRTCALMVPLKNATASAISQFNVQFTWEKWRSGKAKMLNLCYSTGAPAWQWVKLDEFHLGYDASGAALIENDETNAWAAGEENMEYRHFSRKVNINIPAGGIVYLGWFYSATDTNSGNAQAWAVDDVKIRLGEDRTVIIMR